MDKCKNYHCPYYDTGQGCMLPAGCIYWSDTDNKEANQVYWMYLSEGFSTNIDE